MLKKSILYNQYEKQIFNQISKYSAFTKNEHLFIYLLLIELQFHHTSMNLLMTNKVISPSECFVTLATFEILHTIM